MLEADDVGATVAFYTEVLGFTLGDSISESPGDLIWASLVRDGVKLMFTTRHTHEDQGDVEDHDHPERPTMTGSLYFNVDDVDSLALDLGGKVALDYGPTTQPHGMRELGFTDPNGYFLVFGTPVPG